MWKRLRWLWLAHKEKRIAKAKAYWYRALQESQWHVAEAKSSGVGIRLAVHNQQLAKRCYQQKCVELQVVADQIEKLEDHHEEK